MRKGKVRIFVASHGGHTRLTIDTIQIPRHHNCKMHVKRPQIIVAILLLATLVALLFNTALRNKQIDSRGKKQTLPSAQQNPASNKPTDIPSVENSEKFPKGVRKFSSSEELLDWLASSNASSQQKTDAIYFNGQDFAKLGNSVLVEFLIALPDTEYAVSGARLLLHWLPSTISKPSLLELAHSLRSSGKSDYAFALVNSTASSLIPKKGPIPLDCLQSWDAMVEDKQFGELGAFALVQGLLLRGEGVQVLDYFDRGKFLGGLLSSTFGARGVIDSDWRRSIAFARAHPETEFGQAIFREAAGSHFESIRPDISQYFYSLIEKDLGDSEPRLDFFHYWAQSDLNQLLSSLKHQPKSIARIIFPKIKPTVMHHNPEAVAVWEKYLQSE